MLARAVKEYERRGGRKEGFSDSPGDVLAYKHFRDVSGACLGWAWSLAGSLGCRARRGAAPCCPGASAAHRCLLPSGMY